MQGLVIKIALKMALWSSQPRFREVHHQFSLSKRMEMIMTVYIVLSANLF